MEMDLGSKWKGQFFTPYNLSVLLSELSISSKELEEVINRKGYIELNEPTCGSGGVVVAFAESLIKRGYNPNEQLLATAQDLDIRCVWMAYIQLSILGIPAIVIHTNTLTLEVYDKWYTPAYMTNLYRFNNR